MMISPETYYAEHLMFKSKRHIKGEIERLRKEIKRLQHKIEKERFDTKIRAKIMPSDSTRISCNRDYLEKAIETYRKRGGKIEPSIEEKRVAEFNANLQYLTKIELEFKSHLSGPNATLTMTINDNGTIDIERHDLKIKPDKEKSDNYRNPIDKEELLYELRKEYIGEWDNYYSPERFGVTIMDGTSWRAQFYYSNNIPVKVVEGHNDAPYNFYDFLYLFNAMDLRF